MRLRVCIDARMIDSGGIGSYLQAMIETLSKKKEIELILLVQKRKRKLLAHYPATLKNFEAEIFSWKEQILYPIKIPTCELFFSPHFNIPFLPIKAKKRVTVLHDLFHLENASFFKKRLAKFFYYALLFLSDRLLTVSFFSQKTILRLLKKESEVIYPAVFPHFFSLAREKKEMILAVGNIKPHKNLLSLVEAFMLLDLPHHLFLVGKKEGMLVIDHGLIRYIKEKKIEKRVHILGYVEPQELLRLYSTAALFVAPSKYEGFGLPAVEAMAAGCPVIATKRTAIPEVLGDAAYYADCDDPKELAKAMHYLLKEENQKKWIEKGKKQALLYTLERFQKTFCDFCEENCHNL